MIPLNAVAASPTAIGKSMTNEDATGGAGVEGGAGPGAAGGGAVVAVGVGAVGAAPLPHADPSDRAAIAAMNCFTAQPLYSAGRVRRGILAAP